ncbi:hypothetical protein JTB14_007576 [Gonioctena quinquepunctata]|nr:hypothetical protein JTB14_007576 [Gonioctena quinquepunctata]
MKYKRNQNSNKTQKIRSREEESKSKIIKHERELTSGCDTANYKTRNESMYNEMLNKKLELKKGINGLTRKRVRRKEIREEAQSTKEQNTLRDKKRKKQECNFKEIEEPYNNRELYTKGNARLRTA